MKSFRSRLTFWYILAITGTLCLVLLAGRFLLEKELVHGIDLLNAAEWREIAEKLDNVEKGPSGSINPEAFREVVRHAQIDTDLYFFQIFSGDRILFQSPNLHGALLPSAPHGIGNQSEDLREFGALRLSYFQQDGLKIVIASSLKPTQALLRGYAQVSLIMLGMVIIISIFFGYSLTRIALAPISRIQKIADRIRGDHLSERIPDAGGNDEIAQLTRLLNQMFDRLEFSFQQLQRFAGNASHELKTPLSIIRLQSEKLLLHGNLAPAQEEAVQQQLESIVRLTDVIDKLLFLARAQVGVIQIQRQRVSTKEFVEAFTEDALVLCEDRGVEFIVEKNEEGVGILDASLIRQVFLNVISNALHVAPTGSMIVLSASILKGVWRVVISDSGSGLSPDQLEVIFNPFIHGVDRKAPESGTGLGLTISRSIIELHKGKIWAENRLPGPGLRIIFEIPLPRHL